MPKWGLIDALGAETGDLVPVDRFYYDESTDELIQKRSQDVEPYLEYNKRLMNLNDGYSPSREFRRVATIPNAFIDRWYHLGVNIMEDDDWPKIVALLDSPQYRFLRTAPGVIGRRKERVISTGVGSRKSSGEIMNDMGYGWNKTVVC